MKSLSKIIFGTALAILGAQAQALTLSATDPAGCGNYLGTNPDYDPTDPSNKENPSLYDETSGWSGSGPDCFVAESNDSASFIETYTNTTGLTLEYKDEQGVGEEGPFWNHYETTYGVPTDPTLQNSATISWDTTSSSSIDCPDCWLAVKDGKSDPIWYLFDISSWNGEDDIVLTGFFDEKGADAISHVAIYSNGVGVPAPAPLVVMAIGLVGILGMRRMKKTV